MRKLLTQKGFTLIEIVLYFTIITVVLFVILSFSIQVLNSTRKSDNLHELQSNIEFVTNKITVGIHEANSVNVVRSVFDDDDGVLSLDVGNVAKTPTKFYLVDGNVYMEEGWETNEKLNSDILNCTKFRFERVVYPKAPDQIIIDVEFEIRNAEVEELKGDFSIHTSVSLRKWKKY